MRDPRVFDEVIVGCLRKRIILKILFKYFLGVRTTLPTVDYRTTIIYYIVVSQILNQIEFLYLIVEQMYVRKLGSCNNFLNLRKQ